ncbi:MAG: flagellar biosynthesis protein FlhF [Azonexus sp.]
MRIKRFLAPDMRQALRMVREDQGPDAVVISSRRTEAGTELLVAQDYDEQLVAAMGAAVPAARVSLVPPGAPVQAPDSAAGGDGRRPAGPTLRAVGSPHDDALGAMGGELRKLRTALEQQLRLLAGRDDDADDAEPAARAELLGLGRVLTEELIAEARAKGLSREQLWPGVCAALGGRIATIGEDLVNRGGVFALIGPTGVGKTTTVAKLAARFALRYGRRHVALITTDTYRIGAREQLLTFGEILGVPVDFASNPIELAQLLHEHANKRLVLIDNAGLSQRDLRLAAQLSDLDGIPMIKSCLVVSCGTSSAGLDEVFRAFGRARLLGCIVTKLDEAVTLGPVLEALVRHQVPLLYVCDGQRVPEDIHPAAMVNLVERAEELTCEPGAVPTSTETLPEYRAANGFV